MAWVAFILVAAVVGFVVAPRLGFALAHAPTPEKVPALPWVAAGLFLVAWYLPNPDLAHTDTFTQHAVGGGAACAVVALWVGRNAGVRSTLLRLLLAYVAAAALGTLVELAELAYDQLQGTHLSADTPWDLLANSTGAVATALVLEAVLRLSSRSVRGW